MTALPFGSWPSPLSPASLTAATRRLDEVRVDGDDTYWVESRPWEGGRDVLVRHVGATDEVVDVVGEGVNVRSRVHEYGGGAYAVRSGTVVVATMPDLRVHVVEGDGALRAITPEGGFRYGGLVLGDEFALAVREDHSGDGEPINTLVRLEARRRQCRRGRRAVGGLGLRLAPRPVGRRVPGRGRHLGAPQHAMGHDDAARGRRRLRVPCGWKGWRGRPRLGRRRR